MKRLLFLAAILALSSCIHAQTIDATVCEILKNPASFNGKVVRIKGTVIASFDQFAVGDGSCHHNINAIWLAYPEGTKARSGPAAVLQLQPAHNFAGAFQPATRAAVQLDTKSKDFKQFDSLLSAPRKGNGMCLGCGKNEVGATLVGRLDSVAAAGVRRDAAGKIVALDGFGNLNEYSARLVLQSVSDVTAKDVDFSRIDPITKDDNGPDVAGPDANAALRKAVTAFGAATTPGQQIGHAADAFGKQGEHNGVLVSFGATSEASAKVETQSAQDSPDGVIYQCIFSGKSLQGDSMSRAIAHVGQHIYDLRNPQPGTGPYELEYQAWGTTLMTGIAMRQKTLTLAGGYLVWNTAWPQEDREKRADESLGAFLRDHELLNR